MKTINLTQGKVALVDDTDYDWLNQWKWYVNSTHGFWYARRAIRKNEKQVIIKMHRLILGLTDPKVFVDHKDHNTLNNQRDNLRVVTHSQNSQNSSSAKNSSSKYLGVCIKITKKPYGIYYYWHAQITINSKQISLGFFKKEEDAAKIYNKAAQKYYGEFANLNQII